MIIACATDPAFVELAGALLRSIAVNGEVPEAEIVVCSDGLAAGDKDRLIQSAAPMRVRFIELADALRSQLGRLACPRDISATTYIRLLLPELLPEVSGRIVYLDVDVIVNRSLRPLFAVELNGAPLAAVRDTSHYDTVAYINRSIGRSPDSAYINAGVLVMDLDEWRSRELGRRCFEVVVWTKTLMVGDQDAINAIMGDDITLLDRTWNFWSPNPLALRRSDYEAASIVHFPGRVKPNLVECSHPARDMYLAHRANTPWRDQPLKTRKRGGIRGLLDRMIGKDDGLSKPRPVPEHVAARSRILKPRTR